MFGVLGGLEKEKKSMDLFIGYLKNIMHGISKIC